MRIYVESNFLLSIALRQDEFGSCDAILQMMHDGEAELCVPAFAVIEPYLTVERRRRERDVLFRSLSAELDQLERSTDHRPYRDAYREIVGRLTAASEHDMRRLESIRETLEDSASILTMDGDVLSASRSIRQQYKLSAQDSVVLASVIKDLTTRPVVNSCFVTTNSTDFGSNLIVPALEELNCRILFRFEAALDYAGRDRTA